MAFVLSGSGGGGSGGGDDEDGTIVNVVTVDEVSDIPTTQISDTFLQFDYPVDWTVDNSDPTLTGLLSPAFSGSGGSLVSCVFGSTFAPGSSLAEVTDLSADALETLPEPQFEFLTLNGTPVSRITGNVSNQGLVISGVQQIAYEDSFFHLMICVGDLSDETTLILNSMVVL